MPTRATITFAPNAITKASAADPDRTPRTGKTVRLWARGGRTGRGTASRWCPRPRATASSVVGAEGACPCSDGEALRRCNTGLLFSSFFVLVKEREDTQLATKKRRVFLQTAKPDQVTCFQSVTQKINESRAKLSGNFTNATWNKAGILNKMRHLRAIPEWQSTCI